MAKERRLLPNIVEKDYWLMHCLWSLQQHGFEFELKGGTSLSKGFGIIDRFSEDIDIQVHPEPNEDVKIGKNQDRPVHVQSRRTFFEKIASQLAIPDMVCSRDTAFDDAVKMRGFGIRTEYSSLFNGLASLKDGVMLELGFDQTTPNVARDISSWAFEKAAAMSVLVIDNRAKQILCYCPEYTFVEKLQTISTKYRLQQANHTMPVNFLRHYYDVYRLLHHERVLKFIGSPEYVEHKAKRFRMGDESDLTKNPALSLPDPQVSALYSGEFKKKSAIYFGEQPNFEDILDYILPFLRRL
ncbi:MAG: nucleotidyl transferase AbiEii/AbiGii toxin family protein [Gammaproteobacteria bacterium]|nr:nucleotidyl transferase AbiEii/AbiGii toxin family protein [Gammaproteobacteria bacterium]